MRLIHTSDWHLGRTFEREDLIGFQAEFLEWLLGVAIAREVDAVLVAGDIYDRAVPSTDAVSLLDRTLVAFARARIPIVLTSGNHDSAVRLGFGSGLSEEAGVHLRTSVTDVARPVVVGAEGDEVAIYGVPYLLPDAVMTELGAQRSHESVLTAAADRIRDDARARGLRRTVVLAHAFVTGGSVCDSERDVRVGGIGDAPSRVFDGFTYVALGHLHGPQEIRLTDSHTTLRYSGSPLAYSFSEKDHVKSVTLVDIDGTGQVRTELIATPVARPLREVRGSLEELLERADTDLAGLSHAWVKVTLTDPARPISPMERLRERWPHTLVLAFEPEGGLSDPAADLARLAATTDPFEICALFVEYVDNAPPDDRALAVIRGVVEAALHHEVGP